MIEIFLVSQWSSAPLHFTLVVSTAVVTAVSTAVEVSVSPALVFTVFTNVELLSGQSNFHRAMVTGMTGGCKRNRSTSFYLP
ncbi:hypothetical protein F3P66_17775 [Agrobacterium fabrum]|uniref:Uncharacterized protein n=1 Tax=Agrobacterium fabrum (strain C58 / ATCC 33970) TaxID=176299 RepID=Q8U9S8_AGRFC|nr:hypothetical protein Atu3647 [Agrobacterium fabrum str. C58]QRM61298.1 hypothetical protein F3P66_17775 [Agrobacterium fabrum]TRB30222.1 hypothetical protein EXN51_10610 [Agrobacterium fabrum]CAD0212518.1 hypothetical protein AGTUEHA105_LOCUS3422 [Agrobacterium tumefaciens]